MGTSAFYERRAGWLNCSVLELFQNCCLQFIDRFCAWLMVWMAFCTGLSNQLHTVICISRARDNFIRSDKLRPQSKKCPKSCSGGNGSEVRAVSTFFYVVSTQMEVQERWKQQRQELLGVNACWKSGGKLGVEDSWGEGHHLVICGTSAVLQQVIIK